jgi:glycosyltransferase involved in cell wall biosynthesis
VPLVALRTSGYPRVPTAIAYNGIDIERFAPSDDKRAYRERTKLPHEGPIVLSTSNLRPVKNVAMPGRAFAEVRRTKRAILALAGEPYLRDSLALL